MSTIETTKDWLMCHQCGELQRVVAISPAHELVCCTCDNVLHSGHGKWLHLASALVVTSLVLFIFANVAPFITLDAGTHVSTATILDGFWALLERGEWILAGLVVTTIFLYPLFEIFAFLYLLIPYHFRQKIRGQKTVLRWLIQAQSWSMLEVFLVSVVVTAVKLNDLAVVKLEIGAYAFFLLVGVLLLAYLKVDRRNLWAWLNTNNYFASDLSEWVYDCRICHAMVGCSVIDRTHECPRCGSGLHQRIPQSMQKTFALLIASMVLYIPANVLPIMSYTSLGMTETDTIISGVVELISNDLWGIALVVFCASIVVPIAKFVILSYLLWAVHAKFRVGAKHRAFLYRLVELIGRWSMVDVFVVTMLVALVQFGFFYSVEPEPAIIAFGAVVVLTMVAAETFDPRMLWDAQETHAA